MFSLARTSDNPITAFVESEIDDCAEPPKTTSKPLERLRARHHALAMALASGLKPGIAAAAYGYAPSRVAVLQTDPSFAELISHYTHNKSQEWADLQTRLQALSTEAADEMLNRLETEPEKFNITALTAILQMTADRTGHAPKTTTNVNVMVGIADRMTAARERVAKTIEGVMQIEN